MLTRQQNYYDIFHCYALDRKYLQTSNLISGYVSYLMLVVVGLGRTRQREREREKTYCHFQRFCHFARQHFVYYLRIRNIYDVFYVFRILYLYL